jgi:hypothetical protein
MAIGQETDFKIYPNQFFGGMVETLQIETDVWNASSAGVMQFSTQQMRGDYEKQSFFQRLGSLVNDRDPTSTASVTDSKLTQDEIISIKVNKRIGPMAETLDVWKKVALDPAEFSVVMGQQAGKDVAAQYVSSALYSVRAVLKSIGAGVQYDATAQTLKTANHTALVNAMALLGDKSSRIAAFVMHSAQYFELVKQSIADNVFQVAGAVIYSGTPATFGKPVVVTDSPATFDPATGSVLAKYDILALVPGAVEVVESEDRSVLSQYITGLANLSLRIQGEYAYNMRVKNASFTGAINPNDAALQLAANWTFKAQDLKNGPGSRLTTY